MEGGVNAGGTRCAGATAGGMRAADAALAFKFCACFCEKVGDELAVGCARLHLARREALEPRPQAFPAARRHPACTVTG